MSFRPDRRQILRFGWAFVLGTVGGMLALVLGLPLPWLLGSVIFVGLAAMFLPLRPEVPRNLRIGFVPVIGVSIGSAFTPDIVTEAVRWWPSLAALFLFIPAAHMLCFRALLYFDLDRPTAFFGSVPGGLIESVVLGEEAGANVPLLTMLQFLRLILCIIIVPLGFSISTGQAVGSGAGVTIGEPVQLALSDWGILAICAVVGGIGGARIGFPAAVMTGPLLLSGLAHLAGIVHGAPPRWLIDVTQLVIGVSLGCRFVGVLPRLALQAFSMATVNLALTLGLAAIAALILPPLVGEPWEAVVLAFAPGGLAEMSLVALSLELSVLYVTAHHIARIVLSIATAKYLAGKVLDR